MNPHKFRRISSRFLQASLLLPSLIFSGQYSGTVKTISGLPIEGVTVYSKINSTTTNSIGQWTLSSSTTGLENHSKIQSITKNLVMENGRIRISYNGIEINGQSNGRYRNASNNKILAASRTGSIADTIVVQWNNKHLIRLPISNDSSGIAFSIDTAWSDDYGMPWNPYVTYGSLKDSRDNNVYRTIVLGSGNNAMTWMAENLRYAGDSSINYKCYNNSTDSCLKYGYLYTWATARADSQVYANGRMMGVCPPSSGFFVANDSDWTNLVSLVASNYTGTSLKATSGWKLNSGNSGNGTDKIGFRGLPSGLQDNTFFGIGTTGAWWSATIGGGNPINIRTWSLSNNSTEIAHNAAYYYSGLSVRCAHYNQ